MSNGAVGGITMHITEMTMDGSIYTYDVKANTGYVNVLAAERPAGLTDEITAERAGRTVEIGDGINLDFTEDGRLYGIEHIGGPVNEWVLMRALRWRDSGGDA